MAQMFGLARLGKDCDVRYTSSGDAVASLSLAFNYGRRDEDGKRPTQWVEGSLWGKRAESLAPYLTKGSLISITLNDVHIETYHGKSGEGHKLVGQVSEIELAGGNQHQQSRQPAQRQQRGTSQPDFQDDGGDIPF